MKLKSPKINHSRFLALGLLAIIFVGWAFLLVQKYLAFGYYDWDLAFFNQATWNILHGSSHSSLFDINFFGNHSNLIIFLCLPIYIFFQHPLTLVFFKLFSFLGGAYVLYRLAKERLGNPLAILIMFLYCFYPPNMFGLIYEFDYESLSPIFLFGIIYFFEKRSFKFFIFTALLTMLIKENMPFIVMTFSIYALFSRGRNRFIWALIPFVLASIMFYVLIYIFIPFCRGQETHPYLGLYTQFGGSTPLGVILNILKHPWQVSPFLTKPVNLELLFQLFSPLIYLPFFSPHVLFLVLPILLQHLLSNSVTEHYIYYQYALTTAPFLYWAAVKTLSRLRPRMRSSFFYVIITLMMAAHLYSLNNSRLDMIARINIKKDHLNSFRWDMVKAIPKDEAVIASFDFLAELSGRRALYAFYKVYHDYFQNETSSFITPEKVSYALIDFKDGWLLNQFYDKPQETVLRIQRFFSSQLWSVERAAEHLVLFKKGEGERLVEVSASQAEMSSALITVDNKFGLIHFEVDSDSFKSDSLIPLAFTWQSYEDIKERYQCVLFLKKDDTLYINRWHEIGYMVYPTFIWKKAEIIKERFWLYVPKLEMGAYTLEIGFIDRSHNQAVTQKTYPLARLLIREK